MTRKISKAISVILITLLTATLSSFNSVYAQTTVYMEPSNIKDQTMDPGSRFNVTVFVRDVIDLFAYQIHLSVDENVLNITRAWMLAFVDSKFVFYGKNPMPLGPTFYDINDNDRFEAVLIGASLLFGTPTFTGSGKLAIIEFEVMGIGSSPLTITPDTTLIGSEADIPYTPIHGLFDNRPPIKPATLYVDPPKIVDPLLIPSSNFDVDIKIDNATQVNSFEFKLGFNSSVLHAVDVVLGAFFPSGTTQKTIDNTNGFLIFNATLPVSEPPKDGAGTLAVVTFHVESVGISDLDLFDDGCKLADENQQSLPLTPSIDGFFKNLKGAKLYIDPAEIRDPLMKPPRIFSVDVVIDDAENLYGYEFKLGYNTNMLTAIGVEIHVILGEGNFTADWSVRDSMGEIWINVTYYPPAIPITTYTPESLATMTFKVDNVGSSVLDLFDTKLWDDSGTPIPFDEVTDGFVMTEIHDVAITNVVPTPTFVFGGEMVQIDVTVKNKGNVTETFDVKAYYDSNIIDTETVIDLLPNAETTKTFIWDTTGVTDGFYTIKAEAALVPYEFNPGDNIYIDGTVEVQTRIRNLAVLSVTAEPAATYADPKWPVKITVVAKNKGMDPETFDVSVFWNDTNLIATQTVIGLAPDTEVTQTFTWDTTSLTVCHQYKISASVTILDHEIDTTDNWLDDGYVKIKIMGDVNGDGKVDIRDLAILAVAFGSYPGHPRWNPEADLNKDLKVDIRDLARGASNFGKGCAP